MHHPDHTSPVPRSELISIMKRGDEIRWNFRSVLTLIGLVIESGNNVVNFKTLCKQIISREVHMSEVSNAAL